jgi:ABC-type transport system involved in cytochrome bd biosynthesis fused ATPase/permease subunit
MRSKKYETQIGNAFGGREFSGGESQRLAVARMLYRDTPIIILDEPENSLDKESADHLMNSLFSMKDKTVILVTHNMARAKQCDVVIVMSDGAVVEHGSPTDLLQQDGEFTRLVEGKKKNVVTEVEA